MFTKNGKFWDDEERGQVTPDNLEEVFKLYGAPPRLYDNMMKRYGAPVLCEVFASDYLWNKIDNVKGFQALWDLQYKYGWCRVVTAVLQANRSVQEDWHEYFETVLPKIESHWENTLSAVMLVSIIKFIPRSNAGTSVESEQDDSELNAFMRTLPAGIYKKEDDPSEYPKCDCCGIQFDKLTMHQCFHTSGILDGEFNGHIHLCQNCVEKHNVKFNHDIDSMKSIDDEESESIRGTIHYLQNFQRYAEALNRAQQHMKYSAHSKELFDMFYEQVIKSGMPLTIPHTYALLSASGV